MHRQHHGRDARFTPRTDRGDSPAGVRSEAVRARGRAGGRGSHRRAARRGALRGHGADDCSPSPARRSSCPSAARGPTCSRSCATPLVLLAPLLGICALTLVNAVTGLPGLSAGEIVIVAAAAAAASVACYLSGVGGGARARCAPRSSARSGPPRTSRASWRWWASRATRWWVGSRSTAGPSRVDGEVPTLGALGRPCRRDRGERHRPARPHERGAALRRLRGDLDTASTCPCGSGSCPRSTRRYSATCRWPRSTRPGSSTSCTRSSGPSRRHRSARWTSSSRRSPRLPPRRSWLLSAARDQARRRPRLLQADAHRRGGPHAHAVQAAHHEGRRPARAVGRAPTIRA